MISRLYDASHKYGLDSMSVTPELLQYNKAKIGTATSTETEPSSIHIGETFTATQYQSGGFKVVFKGWFSGSNYGTFTNLDSYRTETGELIATNSGSWSFTSGVEGQPEIMYGGNDQIYGNSFNNTLRGYGGNDVIDGGNGLDTVVFSSSRSNYTIARTSTGYIVADQTGADGTETLNSIERLKFNDKTVAFDIDGTAGQVYRLYQAAFNRVPDKSGLGSWIKGMDGGMTLSEVTSGFINSAEFKSLYGTNSTNDQFIKAIYSNVLHRAPDAAGYDDWMNGLANGMSREQVLTGFSESTENKMALMAFNMDGHMGQVYRLYQAALNRKPDVGGVGSWTQGMDNGMTIDQVANGFINSAEFKALYGSNPTGTQFLTLLYNNVLHRAPDTTGYNNWLNGLAQGMTHEQALIGFSQSAENNLSLVGIVQMGIEYV